MPSDRLVGALYWTVSVAAVAAMTPQAVTYWAPHVRAVTGDGYGVLLGATALATVAGVACVLGERQLRTGVPEVNDAK